MAADDTEHSSQVGLPLGGDGGLAAKIAPATIAQASEPFASIAVNGQSHALGRSAHNLGNS